MKLAQLNLLIDQQIITKEQKQKDILFLCNAKKQINLTKVIDETDNLTLSTAEFVAVNHLEKPELSPYLKEYRINPHTMGNIKNKFSINTTSFLNTKISAIKTESNNTTQKSASGRSESSNLQIKSLFSSQYSSKIKLNKYKKLIPESQTVNIKHPTRAFAIENDNENWNPNFESKMNDTVHPKSPKVEGNPMVYRSGFLRAYFQENDIINDTASYNLVPKNNSNKKCDNNFENLLSK